MLFVLILLILHVQENYQDEIAGCDCNIFDDEEEGTDKEINTQVPDKRIHESTSRKTLVVKPHQKRKVRSQTHALPQLEGSLNQRRKDTKST